MQALVALQGPTLFPPPFVLVAAGSAILGWLVIIYYHTDYKKFMKLDCKIHTVY